MDHGRKFLELVDDAKTRIQEIALEDVKKKLDAGEKFLLIDVREDGEWNQGRIPGAIHLGKGVIERDVEKEIPDPGTDVVLYCGGGFRSALSADNLQKMGYRSVKSMMGGYRGWKIAGFPTVNP